ncbi:SDR family NAD(P)-dependent oxidoreductase [Flammeovirga sp. MY04]|uniref:SDR family NAD(P)-dependent oxidoreductase n=1 Tax=Flammeovirga sp. MY04 TaxID=1191459 RepID=UPI0008063FD9|nr:SDR family NAD(P)-dependent oxidoreductase [Flammeovirga sp. MY04]ANQ51336.1 SDR family NAD(P)-dependent oxidoreductase [Flammeovirga sp. MY04]
MKTLQSQSVFITGANGGMGKKTTKILTKRGYKRIAMACRTVEKADIAKIEISNELGNIKFDALETYGGFDMNNPKAIEEAVNHLPSDQPFDVVFLQSGGVVFTKDFQFIEHQGRKFEKTIFQNTIGGYITLYHLKRRGLLKPNAKVIFAGGEGARGIPGMIEKPTFSSPKQLSDYVYGQSDIKYKDMNAMGVSKYSSAILTQKLAELYKDELEVIWFTPGLTYGTNGLAAKPAIERFFLEKIGFGMMALFGIAQSPKAAAQKYVDAIEGRYGKNGDVLGAPDKKMLGKITDQKPMNEALTDAALIDEFWHIIKENFGELPKSTLANVG